VNSLFHLNERKHSKLFEKLSGQREEGYEYYRMTPEKHSKCTITKIKNAAHVFTDFFFFHRQVHITKMPVTHRNERMRHCIQTVENYVNTQCCTCIRRGFFPSQSAYMVFCFSAGFTGFFFLCKSTNF